MILKIAVCDDDPSCLSYVDSLLQQYEALTIKATLFDDPKKLLESRDSFDLIILDIDMPIMNGIEVAREIRKKDKTIKIIYLTSYTDYTLFAFEVHAFAYLLKPVTAKDLYLQLEEFVEIKTPEPPAQLEFQTTEGLLRFSCQEIYYFESLNRFVYLHTTKGTYPMKSKITEIAQSMAPHHFEAPHKSFVVNLYQVKSIHGYDITMMDGSILPLSQKKSSEFRRALNLYLGQERRPREL